jgi:hypothetical protein
MFGLTKCPCNFTERTALLFAGCYLWLSALFNIVIAEWDSRQTVLFLQGQNAHMLETQIVEDLLLGLNIACLFQLISVTFGLIPGVVMDKKRLIIGWIWIHTFQLAGYTIYLFSGVVVYSIVGDISKVILLLYGFANILVGVCACRIAYSYVSNGMSRETTDV